MKLQPYLSFKGNCQQAFNFYKNVLGGNLRNKETWEGKSEDIPESYRNNIQHIELQSGGVTLMGYDASPDTPLNNGNNICLSIDLEDRKEAEELFEALSNGGTIHTPMHESSWDAYFGRCSDQFDIMWMINAK